MSLIGLISDVHGDPIGLELAWAHLTVMGVKTILCAGDLVGYGPFPDRAVAFLEEHRIPSVRGNHDRWALERGLDMPDEFRGGTPNAETLATLKRLEPSLVRDLDGEIVVVVHGSPRGDMEFIAPKSHPAEILRGYLETLDADVLVHGHTHRPMWYRSPEGRMVVNPGSIVSAPVVETSRTFSVVDLKARAIRFFDVESGREVDVPPWPGSS
jgi:putative phosphoesterase